MNTTDPLRQLLVDAADVDRQGIAEALRDLVAIDQSSGRTVLLAGFVDLDARQKVIAVLLTRKAAYLIGLIETESLSNAAVTNETGLAPGTAAPTLKKLRESRLLAQQPDKAYYIPNAQLLAAIALLRGN